MFDSVKCVSMNVGVYIRSWFVFVFVAAVVSPSFLGAMQESQKDDWALVRKKKKTKPTRKSAPGKFSGKRHVKKQKKSIRSSGKDGSRWTKLRLCFGKIVYDPADDYLARKCSSLLPADSNRFSDEIGKLGKIYKDRKKDFKLALAHIYFVSGRESASVELLEDMIEVYPDDLAALYLYASVLLDSGRGNEAMNILKRGAEVCGKVEHLLCGRVEDKLIDISVTRGDFKSASRYFIKRVKKTGIIDDKFDIIVGGLVRCCGEEEAVEFLGEVYDCRKWSKTSRGIIGRKMAALFFEKGDYNSAMVEAMKLLSDYQLGKEECKRVVDIYLSAATRCGNTDKAIKKLISANKSKCVLVNVAKAEAIAGSLGEAEEILKMALKRYPLDEDIILQYVQVLNMEGRVVEAVELLKKKIRKLKSGDVFLKYCYLLLEHYGYAETVKELQKISSSTREAWLHHALEQFYDSQKWTALAFRENEKLTKIEKTNPDNFIRLGQRYNLEGEGARAIKMWEKIVNLYSTPHEGKVRLAEVYFSHGLYEKAEEIYLSLIKNRFTPELARKLALFYNSTGNAKDEELLWRSILNATGASLPLQVEAMERLIELWSRQGTLLQRRKEVERVVERFPGRKELFLLFKAELSFEAGDVHESRKIAEDILLNMKPEEEIFISAMNLLEKTGVRLSDQDVVAKTLIKIAEHNPDKREEIMIESARYCFSNGKYKEAEEILGLLVESDPYSPKIRQVASELYFRAGNWEKAKEILEMLLFSNIDRCHVLYTLAKTLMYDGREGEAAERLGELISICPETDVAEGGVDMLISLMVTSEAGGEDDLILYDAFRSSLNGKIAEVLLNYYWMRALSVKSGDGVESGWMKRAQEVSIQILINGPDGMREKAAKVFARVGDSEGRRELLGRLSYSRNSVAILHALSAVSMSLIHKHGSEGDKLDVIEEYIAGENPAVVGAALIVASLIGSIKDEVLERIVLSAGRKNEFVKSCALLAISNLLSGGSSESEKNIYRRILHDVVRSREEATVYLAALFAIGFVGGERAVEIISGLRKRIKQGGRAMSGYKSGGQLVELAERVAFLSAGRVDDESGDAMAFVLSSAAMGPGNSPSVADSAGYALYLRSCIDLNLNCVGVFKGGIPVEALSRDGTFSILEIIDAWSKPSKFKFTPQQLNYILDAMKSGIGGKLEELIEGGVEDSTSLRNLQMIFDSFIVDGEVGWRVLKGHIAPSDLNAIRKTIGELVSQLDVAFVIDRCMEGKYNQSTETLKSILQVILLIRPRDYPTNVIDVAMEFPDSEEASVAIKILAGSKDPAGVEALRKLAMRSSWKSRIEIVNSIVDSPSPQGCKFLDEISAYDEESAVRLLAMEASSVCYSHLERAKE